TVTPTTQFLLLRLFHLLSNHTGYCSILFFFIVPTTTDLYTLSLHDALPISTSRVRSRVSARYALHAPPRSGRSTRTRNAGMTLRSEEHTSELQSPYDLVCRLLLEKKKHRLLVYLVIHRNLNAVHRRIQDLNR